MDGRDSRAVGRWLADRSQQWRDRVEVVAIDPSAAFRKELGAAWGVKEQLRRLLTAETLAQAWEERMRLGHYVQVARMPETDRLYDTVVAWWEAIEVLVVTDVTTAKVESANTGIKNNKRTGRGFTNSANYRTRILLTSAARAVA